MAANAGINTDIYISTDDDVANASPTYTAIGGINNVSMSHSGNSIDVGVFNVTPFVRRILGIRDVSYSLSGFYDPSDTMQSAIRTAWLNDSAIFIKYMPTGGAAGTGFKSKVRVGSINISASADGVVEWSADLEGDGKVVADDATFTADDIPASS